MAEKPKPKGPVGPAIRWSAADLARMSKVTPADVETAKRRFRKQAPRRRRRLLDG